MGAEALYDQYSQVLLLAIIRIVPQKKIAEDLLEQTFIKAWHSFDLYSTQQGTVLTWMMAIARGLAKDFLNAHSFPSGNKTI